MLTFTAVVVLVVSYFLLYGTSVLLSVNLACSHDSYSEVGIKVLDFYVVVVIGLHAI